MTHSAAAAHSEVMSEETHATDEQTRDALIEEIARRCGVRAERGRRFAELTSLRVGGVIEWLLIPETEEQAAAVVGALEDAGVAWRVLGAGSNVLADDREHRYVVVSTREVKGEAQFDGERVSVSAGFSLPRLCVEAARHGLSGIEGLGGIPGTVGGALWMNAGAYGHEIGEVVESVRVARGGHVVVVPGNEVKWDYRHTSFKEGELLLGCTLKLRPDDPEKIAARMEEAKRRRFATQPHGARSAGCFFKNPPGSGLSTGKMIDEMGMKGERRGGARVSPVHANFIVTEGKDARAADALALAEEIRERFRREHGIELEYEVELWGADAEFKDTKRATETDEASGGVKDEVGEAEISDEAKVSGEVNAIDEEAGTEVNGEAFGSEVTGTSDERDGSENQSDA